MAHSERNTDLNSVGYESLVWVRDEAGKEFSCSVNPGRGQVKNFNELSQEEKATCMDVNQIVGTERW
ncbi:hypothetical protein [Desulfogranum japonicum]|uniref:hypothetical protein n=1 Tax=Desulfogranum japonicum TaxID=231447 RepID=UPI000401EA97|nr:hypothetical protein [Desulfogranum japonicum]